MGQDSNHSQPCPPWQENCANKRQQKRTLSGERDTAATPTRTSTHTASGKPPATPLGVGPLQSLGECFADVVDPRLNRRKRHLLLDIIVIAILAVIANADTWKDIHIWGESHYHWLGSLLTLPQGIPSRDTFRRTISRLEPQAFQEAFLRWLAGLRKGLPGVIAIDGKSLRGSKTAPAPPLHIVST